MLGVSFFSAATIVSWEALSASGQRRIIALGFDAEIFAPVNLQNGIARLRGNIDNWLDEFGEFLVHNDVRLVILRQL